MVSDLVSEPAMSRKRGSAGYYPSGFIGVTLIATIVTPAVVSGRRPWTADASDGSARFRWGT